MNIFGIFRRRRVSDSVSGACLLCKNAIPFIYSPETAFEKLRLFGYTDIDTVWICKECGSFRHWTCAEQRHKRLEAATEPPVEETMQSLLDGLKPITKLLNETVKTGESQGLRDFLSRETRGFDCPSCGSKLYSEVFVKKDDTPIEVRSGKRLR